MMMDFIIANKNSNDSDGIGGDYNENNNFPANEGIYNSSNNGNDDIGGQRCYFKSWGRSSTNSKENKRVISSM